MIMRKIIVSNFVSLDGYIAGPNGELDWYIVNKEFLDYAEDMLNSVDTILFGRKTYEMMADYWPMPEAKSNDPAIADKMNGLPKIVFSKTLAEVDWENSSLVKEMLKKRW